MTDVRRTNGDDLVRQCRFNKPTDEIDDEEYTMYTYAMRVWLLQDRLGLSFETACLFNHELREWPFEHLVEFRPDYWELNDEEKEQYEQRLWKEMNDDEDRIRQWAKDNLKRFQAPSSNLHFEYEENDSRPEFDYHV